MAAVALLATSASVLMTVLYFLIIIIIIIISYLLNVSLFSTTIVCIFRPVPESYFCNLDHTGRRHDINEKPELTRGVVDFTVTKVASGN
jgi:hypothetical protein